MRNLRFCLLCWFFGWALLGAAPADAEIQLEQTERGVRVEIDDSLFAEYLINSGGQPAVWPIVGPTGAAYTRSYPIGPLKDLERDDHPHHRSLWFAHGDVNGYDFWANTDSEKKCEIVHRQYVITESSGSTATIETVNDWVVSGEKLCEDQRTLVFGADESMRWIDFTINLIASSGELTFGDTKEGTFAVRVAGSMKVDSRGKGTIVNSRGQRDKNTWGQPAEWVDYYGPVEGETVGIAMLSHPDSVRHPCKWHVRSYGLFAANPFGEKDFPESEVTQGEVVLPAGDELTLRYRVLFHRGDAQQADIAGKYAEFARETATGEQEN